MLAENPDLELTNRMDLKRHDGGIVPFEVSSVESAAKGCSPGSGRPRHH